jgi:exosortase
MPIVLQPQAAVSTSDSPPAGLSIRLWAQTAALAGMVLILYARVLYDLFLDWWNEPQLSQGLLIPPLALYVAWLRRGQTLRHAGMRDLRGVWITALACSLYLLGRLGAEFFLTRISFVLLLAGFVYTFWGPRRLQSLTLPFLLLATMVPLPSIVYNTISAPLQLLASEAATSFVRFLGVTVHRDGNLIHLAGTTLGVEEACSGLSSLSTLVVASVLLGFLHGASIPVRWLLFSSALPIAIAANVLRVAGTAFIAEYTVDVALGFYHLFSGWLVFVVGLAALYATVCLLDWIARKTSSPGKRA